MGGRFSALASGDGVLLLGYFTCVSTLLHSNRIFCINFAADAAVAAVAASLCDLRASMYVGRRRRKYTAALLEAGSQRLEPRAAAYQLAGSEQQVQGTDSSLQLQTQKEENILLRL